MKKDQKLSQVAKATNELSGPKQVVGSIVHAVAVLRLLSDTESSMGVTAIAKTLGMSSSSCFNVLRTLVSEGLLEFDSRDKTYSLGLGTVELASRALSRNNLFPFVRQRLERIANEHELTAILWRGSHGRRLVVVGAAESNADLQVAVKVGYRVPLLAGGVGKCMAAFGGLTAEELSSEFDRVRTLNKSNFETFLKDLDVVRKKGWAIDRGNFKSGVLSVASPVFDARGAIAHCFSGVMFDADQSEAHLDRIGSKFRELAESIKSRNL